MVTRKSRDTLIFLSTAECLFHLRVKLYLIFQECPSGVVNEDTFKDIYAQFFPQGGWCLLFGICRLIGSPGDANVDTLSSLM